MIEDRLLSVREAARILGLKPKTIYQWRWRKLHLPFIKIGKVLRISEKDLMDFIERKKKHPDK